MKGLLKYPQVYFQIFILRCMNLNIKNQYLFTLNENDLKIALYYLNQTKLN